MMARSIAPSIRSAFSCCAVALLFSWVLFSCAPAESRAPAKDRGDAESLAQRFYALQRAGEFEKIDGLLSKAAREQKPLKQRMELLQLIDDRFGTEKELTIESWQSQHGDPADSYELVYQVIRSKRVARETLRMVVESDSLRIASYNVDSDGSTVSY